MDTLNRLGELGLATRLKRLSERLSKDVSLVYSKMNIDFEARWFPVIYTLKKKSQMNITEIAHELGITHTAVIQLVDELGKKGYINSLKSKKDERSRIISLSGKGKKLFGALMPVWGKIKKANEELIKNAGGDIISLLNRIEKELDKRSMYERIMFLQGDSFGNEITICEYSPKMKKHFQRLNYEWLEEFFTVEKEDKLILSDPKTKIINKGGVILFALVNNNVVGTCALIKHNNGNYELAKMAVTKKYRGHGIGKILLNASIKKMKELRKKELYLQTNKNLIAANKLYKKIGFQKMTKNLFSAAKYERETYAMMLKFL